MNLVFLAVGFVFGTARVHVGTSRLQAARLIGCLTGWAQRHPLTLKVTATGSGVLQACCWPWSTDSQWVSFVCAGDKEGHLLQNEAPEMLGCLEAALLVREEMSLL